MNKYIRPYPPEEHQVRLLLNDPKALLYEKLETALQASNHSNIKFRLNPISLNKVLWIIEHNTCSIKGKINLYELGWKVKLNDLFWLWLEEFYELY